MFDALIILAAIIIIIVIWLRSKKCVDNYKLLAQEWRDAAEEYREAAEKWKLLADHYKDSETKKPEPWEDLNT